MWGLVVRPDLLVVQPAGGARQSLRIDRGLGEGWVGGELGARLDALLRLVLSAGSGAAATIAQYVPSNASSATVPAAILRLRYMRRLASDLGAVT